MHPMRHCETPLASGMHSFLGAHCVGSHTGGPDGAAAVVEEQDAHRRTMRAEKRGCKEERGASCDSPGDAERIRAAATASTQIAFGELALSVHTFLTLSIAAVG